MSDSLKRKNVFTLVKRRINFTGMSRCVLATNWHKATEAKKETFITSFETIIFTVIERVFAIMLVNKLNTSQQATTVPTMSRSIPLLCV